MENQFGDMQAWNDLYKDAHGVRPRHNPTWTCQADYIAEMTRLSEIACEPPEGYEGDADLSHLTRAEIARMRDAADANRATLADLWPA